MTSSLPAERRPWMSPRLSRGITAVLAILVLAAAAVIVVQLVSVRPRYLEAQAEDQARAEAVRSAERFVVEANNFDASDLPTLKQRLSPMLTTKFRSGFEATIDDILVQIEEAELVSEGEVLRSAVANAESAYELGPDELRVRKAIVDEGPTSKLFLPRALGRATKINKRTSHMTIDLTTTSKNER